MDHSSVIFLAGQIIGTALRFTVAEAEAARASPDLTPYSHALILEVARFRRALERLMTTTTIPNPDAGAAVVPARPKPPRGRRAADARPRLDPGEAADDGG